MVLFDNHFIVIRSDRVIILYINNMISGWLYDITHDYTLSFYMAGGCMLASAVVMLPSWLWTTNTCFTQNHVKLNIDEKQINQSGDEKLMHNHSEEMTVIPPEQSQLHLLSPQNNNNVIL